MKIDFGKYQGDHLHELPVIYLRWLLTLDHVPEFRKAIRHALKGESYTPPSLRRPWKPHPPDVTEG